MTRYMDLKSLNLAHQFYDTYPIHSSVSVIQCDYYLFYRETFYGFSTTFFKKISYIFRVVTLDFLVDRSLYVSDTQLYIKSIPYFLKNY